MFDNASLVSIRSVTFTVDTVPPVLAISSPSENQWVNDPTVSWSATDVTSAVAGYQYQVDGGVWSTMSMTTSHLFCGLMDGDHVATVRAYDLTGSFSTAFVDFKLDATVPSVNITSPSGSHILASSTVSVVWAGNDALSGVVGYQYRIGGGGWSDIVTDTHYDFSGLGEGTHTVDILVWDAAGNSGTDTVTFMVDTIAPTLSISSPSNGFVSGSTTVTVVWGGSDGMSGLQGYNYSLDGGAWSPLSMTGTEAFSALAQGNHTVSVRAYDYAFNMVMKNVTFDVDTIKPIVTITTPANGFITGSSTVQINWAGSDENSGVWHYRSQVDSAGWSVYSNSLTRTFTSLTTGAHVVHVEVQDIAGNTGSATVNLTVDMVAPDLIISAPANNAYFNVSIVNVFWNGTDVNTGIQGYEFMLDNGSYSAMSTSNSHTFVGLDDRVHTVTIRAFDNVNNSVTYSVSFTVDTVAPIVTVNTPTEGQLVNSRTITWTGSDVTAGILNYRYRIDAGNWSAPTVSLTTTFTGLVDGPHVVQVRAFDKAGNSAITFRNFTLDATPPVVIISSPSNLAIYNVTTVSVNWNGTDNLAGINGYQYNLDNGGYSATIGSLSHSFSLLAQGTHTVIIKVIDNAGNINTTTIQFRVDSVAPVLTISTPNGGSYSTSPSVYVAWSASDATVGVQGYQYRIDGAPLWSNLSLATINHTFTGLSDGSHTVEVRAFDYGNLLDLRSVTFIVDTVNPTLAIDNPANWYLTNATSVTVYWNGSDATAGIQGYQYSLDGAAFSGTAAPISHLFSSLLNGNHHVDIKAVDKAGLTTIKRVNFTIDNVAPTLSVLSPSGGAYLGSSTVVATWNATDATSGVQGYQYQIDGLGWSARAMVLTNTFFGLSDASHTIDVRVFDNANNVRTVSVTFVVDVTVPLVSITSPVDRALVGAAVVNWTGSDLTSGVLGYQYRVDNVSWSLLAMSYTNTFVGLADGHHFVEVRATDRSGNKYTVSVNFTLDATPPLVSITSPAGGYITNVTSVTVNWTGSDSPAGIQGYKYRLDSGLWSTMDGSLTNNFVGLLDGLHTVYVQAIDNAGNSATTSVVFRVDTTAPAVSITSPAGGYYSNSWTVSVVWTATDGGSGVKGYQYHIDGNDWSALSGAKSQSFTGLGEGNHTVYIRSTDNASNAAVTSVTFNVDTVMPSVHIDSPANLFITNITSVTVSWSGSDATSGVKGYQYKLDTGSWSGISMVQTFGFSSLTNMVHTVYVRIYDKANNTAQATVNFTMDNVMPTLAISSPTSGSYTGLTSTTVVWTGSDALSGVQGYQYSLDGAAWSSLSMSTSQAFSGLIEGDHTVRIRAIDNAQNSHLVSTTIHVDLTAPTLNIISPTQGSIYNSSTVTVTWSAADGSSGVQGCQYQVDGKGFSVLAVTLSHAFGGLTTGYHNVDIISLDNVGNSRQVSVNFTVDVTMPTLTITAPTAGHNFNITSILATWTGGDVGTGLLGYRYHADALAWSSFSMNLSNTFTLSEATHTITVEVRDNAGNHVSATVAIRVDLTAPTLSITAPGAYKTTNSVTISWTRSDSGSGVQGSSYRIDNGSWSGIVYGTTSHTFTPLTDQLHTVDVRCYDNASNVQLRSVSFTVDTVAPTLVIDNPVNLYKTNATSVTVYWNASDATSGIQGYQWALDGVSYTGTAAISHTFSVPANGLHYVNIKALDNAGLSTVKRVNFTIDNVPPVITISAPASGAYLNSSSVTATWSATDATTLVSGYQYCIDAGAWSAESMTVTTVFTGIADGTHTVHIRAFDTVNNLATSSVTFIVDTTPPSVSIQSPAEGSLVTSIVVHWNGTDSTSGMQRYDVSIDNGTFSSVAMALTHTFATTDGGHFIQIKAVDRSGNFAITSVHVTLDTSAPIVSITAPAGGYITNSTTVTVNWNGHDVFTAIQGYEYQIDSNGWSTMGMGLTTDFSGLGDGLHTAYVKAFDLVNNTATTSVTFRVDTVAPTLAISSPGANAYDTVNTMVVSWTRSDANSGIQGCSYRIDNGSWSAIVYGTVSFTFTSLSDKVHTVDVRCYDNASNVQLGSVSFTVDTVDPILNIDSPANHYLTNVTSVTVSWSGSDLTAGIKGYQYQIDSLGYSTISAGLSQMFVGLTNGVHRIDVMATDNASRFTIRSVNVTVDNVAPVLSIASPASGSYLGSSSVTATWNATDATTNVSGYQYQIDNGPWSARSMLLTAVFNNVGDGVHTIYVRSFDAAENVRNSSVTFTVDVTPPTVAILSPNEGSLVTSVVVSWNGSDPTSGMQRYEISVDNGTFSSVAMALTHTFALADGGHFIQVKAIDRSGNFAIASVHLTLDTSVPIVAITSPADNYNSNSSTVTVNWTGHDVITGIQGYEYQLGSSGWSTMTGEVSHDFGVLSDGVYTVYVKAFDLVGNNATTSVTFRVDMTAPALTITAPSNNSYGTVNSMTVTWTRSDSGSGVQGSSYRLDTGQWSSISFGMTSNAFTGLADGVHTVYVRAIDNASNVCQRSVTFTVDTVNPTLVIDSPANGYLTNATSATVFWNGSDATAGIQGYQYQLDGQGYLDEASGTSQTFDSLANGAHRIDIKAIDNAGRSTVKSINLTIDNVAPTLTIDVPTSEALINVSSASVSWSTNDPTSGMWGTQYRLDGGNWSLISGVNAVILTDLADGHHVVDVRAFDRANNTVTKSIGFTIDTVRPVLTIDLPSNGAIIRSSSVAVNWTGTDVTSVMAGYQARIDTGDWSGQSMDLGSEYLGLSDGPHTVYVRAFDAAGHWTVKSVNFTVDTVPPIVVITSPTNGTYWNTPSVHVTWTSSDLTTAVQGFKIKVGEGAWSSAFTDEFADVAFSGDQTVYVQAWDLAGNGQNYTVHFTIDTVTPYLSIIAPVEGHMFNVSWLDLLWSAGDNISGIDHYQVRVDGDAWSGPLTLSAYNVTGLVDGHHLIWVRATDKAGNVFETSVGVIIDTVKPTVTITSLASGHYSSSTSNVIAWNGGDVGVGVQGSRYRVDNGTWSAMTTNGGHTFDLPDGGHTVYVMVYDWANLTATTSVSFTVDTVAPTITITSPTGGYFTNSSTLRVNWTGSDATAGVRGYQYLLGTGEWSSEDMLLTNAFAGLTDGQHTVFVRVYDRSGNMAETNVSFTVDTTGPSLSILTPTSLQILNSSNVNVSWSGNDLTTWVAGYRYSLDNGAWSPLSMGLYHMFTGLEQGNHSVTVMAYDHVYNPTFRTIAFMVDTVDPTVTIVQPGQGIFSNGSTMGVTWAGNDNTSGVMGFRFKLDNGAWSDYAFIKTHVFGAMVDGWHTVYVEVKDNASNVADTSVTFLVDRTAPAVDIVGPADGSVVNSSHVGWSGSDPTSDIRGYQYRLDNDDWSPLSMATENMFVMTQGPHTVYVRAWDRANNTATVAINVVYDTVAPFLTIVSPAQSSAHNQSSVNVVWSAIDNSSSVTGYQFRLDDGAWSSLNANVSNLFSGLTDGTHNVSVRAFDNAGNCAEKETTVLIDTHAPMLLITAPIEGQKTASSSVHFVWSGQDVTSGMSGLRFRLDGGAWSQTEYVSLMDFALFLADGHHRLDVQAFDIVNNVASGTANFTVDTVAPTLVIDSPAMEGLIPADFAVVNWHATDLTTGVAGYQCRIDGGSWSSLSGTSFNFTSLGEGRHTVDVRSFDQVNNTVQESVNFTVDTVAPDVSILAPSAHAFLSSSSVLLNWTGDDATTGILGYEYRLNGGQWSAMTASLGVPLTLPDGNYSLEVRAFDRAGNNATASLSFTVDTVPPVPVFVTPSHDINTNSTTLHVRWSASDATSGVDSYRFRIDGGAWVPMNLTSDMILSQLLDGKHRLDVRAMDRANNTATISVNVTVDTVAPSLEILSPENGTITNSTAMTVSWTGDDLTTGIAGYLYRLDGGSWSALSASNSRSFTGLRDGVHTVDIEAIDNANNSFIVPVNFTVDTIPPVLVITAPINGWISNHSSVTADWSAIDQTTGVLGYQYSIDGQPWSPVSDGVEHVFDGLGEGSHQVTVRAWDNAGNAIETTADFTVDTVVPLVQITAPTEDAYTNSTLISWNGFDATSGILGYQYRLDGGQWSSLLEVRSIVLVGVADGQHILEVRATDNADNNATASVRFVLDTVSPTALVLGPSTGARLNDSTVTFVWSVNGTGSPLVVVRTNLDGGPWVLSNLSALQRSLTDLTDGEHWLFLQVTDAAGNSNNAWVTFWVDTVAPTIVTSPTGTGVPSNAHIVVGFSEVMDQSSVTVDVAGVDGQVSWSGNNITLTPAKSLVLGQTYSVSVQGRDLAGNPVSGKWTFTVIANGTVTGRIVDSQGNPIANATVSCGGKNVTTDANGEFTLDLVGGDYAITVSKEGKVLAEINATSMAGKQLDLGSIKIPATGSAQEIPWALIVGTATVCMLLLLVVTGRRKRVYVVMNGTVTGTVLDQDDHPVSDAAVSLDSGQVTITDSAGGFRFDRPSMTHHIAVHKDGLSSPYFPVTAVPGETARTKKYSMRRR